MSDVPRLRGGDEFAALGLLIGPYDETDRTWRTPVLGRIAELAIEFSGDPRLPTVLAVTNTMVLPTRAFMSGRTPSIHQLFSHLGHYTSSYCLHARHVDCRLTCKHDLGELCNCWCHEID
jgi:hypothetical protein